MIIEQNPEREGTSPFLMRNFLGFSVHLLVLQCPEDMQYLGVNVQLYGLITVQFSNVAM